MEPGLLEAAIARGDETRADVVVFRTALLDDRTGELTDAGFAFRRRCDAIMDAAVKMRGKVGDAADSDRRDGGWREAGDLIDRICERLDYQLPRVGPDIRNSMDW